MQLIYSIPQSHCVILERFGTFARIQREGLSFRIPFLEQIHYVPTWRDNANKRGYQIELAEQQTDTQPRTCHTRDNVQVTANASVYWRIVDPIRAIYEVDVLPIAVSDIALNALRANIGALDLDAVLSERQALNDRIAVQLSETSAKWGIQFTRVEIQELTTDASVSTAMLQQMDAERRKRAVIADAEGQSTAAIQIAEGERQATILRAHGAAAALDVMAQAERNYLQTLSEAVSSEDAARLLLAQKVLDGFGTITKNPSDKVFLPSSFQPLLSVSTDGKTVNPDAKHGT